MDNTIKRFNLRVYGILIHENAVLVTDEHRGGVQMTKFPGGGLEKGEGLSDCLIREFEEELNLAVGVEDFFYVNDFFQQSAFKDSDQLISFYYRVRLTDPDQISVVDSPVTLKPNEQVFRWISLDELTPSQFTFPIDRVVSTLLKQA